LRAKKGDFVGAITDRPKCKRYKFAEIRSEIRRFPAGRSMIAPTVLRFFDSLKCRPNGRHFFSQSNKCDENYGFKCLGNAGVTHQNASPRGKRFGVNPGVPCENTLLAHFTLYSFGAPWAPKMRQLPTPRRRRMALRSSAQSLGSQSTEVMRMGAYWLCSAWGGMRPLRLM